MLNVGGKFDSGRCSDAGVLAVIGLEHRPRVFNEGRFGGFGRLPRILGSPTWRKVRASVNFPDCNSLGAIVRGCHGVGRPGTNCYNWFK